MKKARRDISPALLDKYQFRIYLEAIGLESIGKWTFVSGMRKIGVLFKRVSVVIPLPRSSLSIGSFWDAE